MPKPGTKNIKRNLRWKRILLKLSGETLGGAGKFGIDADAAEYVAREIKEVADLGCEIVIAIGGGNFIRGEKLARSGIDRPTADMMGMLGHLINALALQSVLERSGLRVRVMSAITAHQVAELYTRPRAMRHLENGEILILAAGTGNPYLTTDTAAVIRASEMNADVILKATNVDGVYTADPRTHADAKLLKTLGAAEMVDQKLKVMDLTAATLSMESGMPIIVFNVFKKGNLKRLVRGERIGSEILPRKN